MDFAKILDSVGEYYGAKVMEHGATPRGVDWNSSDSQRLRFQELLRVCNTTGPFSILDYGCGYGALYDFLEESGPDFDYHGFDIASEMIERARHLHTGKPRCEFSTTRFQSQVDYAVASGIFNVMLETAPEEWTAYVLSTLATLARVSRRGFAFNMLTRYSDAGKMRAELYYGDPCFYFGYCKAVYSRNVALLHDYGLYEFTIIVRLDA